MTIDTPEAFTESVLRAFESGQGENVLSLCHPDVVFEFPFLGLTVAREDFDRKIMRTLSVMKGLAFTDIDVEPLQRPGWFVARYRASATIASTGNDYHQTYITLIGTRDGRMTYFAEHFDTAAFQKALTPTGNAS